MAIAGPGPMLKLRLFWGQVQRHPETLEPRDSEERGTELKIANPAQQF